VTGLPKDSAFSYTVKKLQERKQASAQFAENRESNPVKRGGIRAEKIGRFEDEDLLRQQRVAYRESRMPPNERRARKGAIDIVTGDVKDSSFADIVDEFPRSNPSRAVLALEREAEIIERRLEHDRAQTSHAACRCNNGRVKEIRDFNIINGRSEEVVMSNNVKFKPSQWEWLQREKMD
jgi:hypothetical protein